MAKQHPELSWGARGGGKGGGGGGGKGQRGVGKGEWGEGGDHCAVSMGREEIDQNN